MAVICTLIIQYTIVMVMNKKIHSENKEHTFDETHNDSSVETEQTRQNDNINNTTNDLPEGGWGWLIVISSVVIHFIVGKNKIDNNILHCITLIL